MAGSTAGAARSSGDDAAAARAVPGSSFVSVIGRPDAPTLAQRALFSFLPALNGRWQLVEPIGLRRDHRGGAVTDAHSGEHISVGTSGEHEVADDLQAADHQLQVAQTARQ